MDTTIPSPNPELLITRQPRRRFTEEARRTHLANWKASGLSSTAYGREHGLSAPQLYLWRKRTKTRSAPSRKARVVDASEEESSRFISLRLNDGAAAASPSASPRPSSLQVAIRHGAHECTVSGISDHAEVVALLRAIKREVLGV